MMDYWRGQADRLFTDEWRSKYPNFTPHELASDNDEVLIFVKALDALQTMRTEFGCPLIINSAYRNPAHNKRVGGSKRSMHLKGHAFDIALHTGLSGNQIEALAREHGFNGIGRYSRFIHLDMRLRAASWGTW